MQCKRVWGFTQLSVVRLCTAMAKAPVMTGSDVDKAALEARRSWLMGLRKGTLWYMVPKGSKVSGSLLTSTSAVGLMVIAIMRGEEKERAEKGSGEGGGCGWYVACLLTRAFQLQALLQALLPGLRRGGLGVVVQR